MRLTTYNDYALRTLMYLAVDKDRPVTNATIAKTYLISETHLMKMVHQLGIAGDIAITRGRKAGYASPKRRTASISPRLRLLQSVAAGLDLLDIERCSKGSLFSTCSATSKGDAIQRNGEAGLSAGLSREAFPK
jgi:Rrf2 family nitric oxide-sensitive transcriptional repressor